MTAPVPHTNSEQRSRGSELGGHGFTLVELLVVIGIIALLIAILLPALSRARQTANRTACEAKLKNIMLAATIHQNNFRGFYPLVGVLPSYSPAGLNDTYSTNYDYLPPSVTAYHVIILKAIDLALARDMSYSNLDANNPNNAKLQQIGSDSAGYERNFWCPSQASTVQDFNVPVSGTSSPYTYYAFGVGLNVATQSYNSYIFNEAVLGWGKTDTYGRFKGKASLIRQASATMFAADGLGGSPSRPDLGQGATLSYGFLSLYNVRTYPPVTVADAYLGTTNPKGSLAGDPANFDAKRHQGKINIAFCDGHVETRAINAGDLNNVYLMAP